MLDGTHVDPSTKGLGPTLTPDEWLIRIRLNDRPNRPWSLAWREQQSNMNDDLDDADWAFDENEQAIYLWATAANAETLIRQLDTMLNSTNKRCAQLVTQTQQRRTENTEHRNQTCQQAAQLQHLLNNLDAPT